MDANSKAETSTSACLDFHDAADALRDSTSKQRCPPTECVVCGGAARGYHYDIVSCNGCRSFFRRSITTQRNYKCKRGSGNCNFMRLFSSKCYFVGRGSRCRACRFQACITAGMNPLAIESEAVVENGLVQKICETLQRGVLVKQEPLELVINGRSLRETNSYLQPREVLLPDSMTSRCESLLTVEAKVAHLRYSTFSIVDVARLSLRHFLKLNSVLGKVERYKIVNKWEDLPRDPPHLTPPPPHDSDTPAPNPQKNECPRRMWLFFDIVVGIEYAKTFSFFNDLDEHDKVSLLRNSVLLCVCVTQGYDSLRKGSDAFELPDGWAMLANKRRHPLGTNPMAEFVTNLAMGPLLRLRPTETEYVLLKAIMFCDAASPLLSTGARLVVATERHAYANALLACCRRDYGAVMGATRYAELITIVDGFVRLAVRQKECHLMFKVMSFVRAVRTSPRALPAFELFDEILE